MLDDFLGPKRPLDWSAQFWPVLVASFACAMAATWLCKSIALRLNIVDKPDNLVKTHKKPVAYLGGIGVLVGFSVGILCGVYLVRERDLLPDVMRWLFGILAGAAIACFVGVLDDIFDISPAQKVLGQTIAALTILLAGILPDFSEIVSPFGFQMSDGSRDGNWYSGRYFFCSWRHQLAESVRRTRRLVRGGYRNNHRRDAVACDSSLHLRLQ